MNGYLYKPACNMQRCILHTQRAVCSLCVSCGASRRTRAFSLLCLMELYNRCAKSPATRHAWPHRAGVRSDGARGAVLRACARRRRPRGEGVGRALQAHARGSPAPPRRMKARRSPCANPRLLAPVLGAPGWRERASKRPSSCLSGLAGARDGGRRAAASAPRARRACAGGDHRAHAAQPRRRRPPRASR